MSSQRPAQAEPQHRPGPQGPPRVHGQSARGRMSAPAPNNRMPGAQTRRASAGEQQGGRSRPVEQANQRARNPVGSPPPNQRNSPQQQQQQQQQHRGSPQGNPRPGHSQNRRSHQRGRTDSGDLEADEAARSALALAAVAQAANASNKSPAEAAEIAKAHAQNIAKKQHARRGPPARPEVRKVQPVNLESVKGLLRSETAANEEGQASTMLEKLADGENDSFLQHLLLFEYLRAEEDDGLDLNASLSQMDDMKTENMKTSYACDRVSLLLSKVELAYDSMLTMLPEAPSQESDSSIDFETDDVEAPIVVPDLLPPCTSKPGDATLEFFHACSGDLSVEPTSDEKENPQVNDDATDATDFGLSANEGNKDAFADHDDKQPSSSSMFSNMFGMKRPSFNKKGFASVFGKKRKGGKPSDDADSADDNGHCGPGEYTVQIEREMLGLTVENVLERTVVRTVLAGGPAKKAGAKVGSLIVKVGNIETRNLTHFETIDELRQSQRPLQLVLRHISDDALRSAREEMGRLIRGSGFGKIVDGEAFQESKVEGDMPTAVQRPMAGGDRNIDFYTSLVRKRWLDALTMMNRNKRDDPIIRVGEKLIWILTLFVVGLEREADILFALAGENESEIPKRSSHAQYHHTAKDYAEAAKSVAKVLFDFSKKRMEIMEQPRTAQGGVFGGRQGQRGGPMGRGGRGRGGRGGISMVPGMPGMSGNGDDGSSEKLLLQIGEVLQRTRTFFADPTSPPAALFRGEVMACLCDILDADTEMKLSETESMSATQGGSSGPITDLGSAGSLLKLIVLNCPIMRSPGCEEISSHLHIEEDEIKRRFGEKKAISGSDFHRLHAGNRFLAVVHRLAASRSTSARITACSLGPVLWSHLDFPHQLQVSFRNFVFCFAYLFRPTFLTCLLLQSYVG
jgi:hypothetical protein